ncbi:fungal-specific transcription factor domain-containing protein [Aspergillus pseudoustus]|uniref:Fungal-specific transcription factor domain-containing protein n=1 Tax=Aspergillus pseudoustus TaxID=1810923 RepID=A0ABR4JWI8_9EURO
MRSGLKKRRIIPPDEPPAGRWEGNGISEYHRSTAVHLSERVAQLERLVQLLPDVAQTPQTPTDNESSAATTSHETSYIRESRSARAASRPPTYSGETSIRSTLEQVEAHLDRQPHIEPNQPSEVATPALTPPPLLDTDAPPRRTSDLCKTLHDYDIVINKSQWDYFMKIFCDEVHILYPLLNPRALWEQYDLFWKDHITSPSGSRQFNRERRVSLSQILICLAIGRCTASPRVAGQGGRHSAGWSFYSAALELFGDLLDCFEECSNQLLLLQTLSLMVIYLFRLDVVSKAQKVLALTISHAYHLGLHRSQSDGHSMGLSETEMSRRVWWCLYILDRRLAIEGGHPFLISDVDVNTPFPLLSGQDFDAPEPESARPSSSQPAGSLDPTPIPYFIAMSEYSKVLGRVWEAVYSPGSGSNLNASLCAHLEHLLFCVQKQIPPIFRYYPDAEPNAQPDAAPWWLTKQQALMRIRWLSLRVLIRKPMLQKSMSGATSDPWTFENDAISLQIMKNVIEESIRLPEEQAVFTFPFFHDVLRAVLISLGLLIKEPVFKEQYRVVVVRGVRLLEAYCQKTWVSGKLIRTVAKLNQTVSRLFGTIDHHVSHLSQPHRACKRLCGAPRLRSIEGLQGTNPSAPACGDQSPQQDSSTMPRIEEHYSEADDESSSSNFPSLTSPLMTDFDFERGTLGSSALDSSTSASYSDSSVHVAKHREAGNIEDLDWLYALFGDYLDPALIVFH